MCQGAEVWPSVPASSPARHDFLDVDLELLCNSSPGVVFFDQVAAGACEVLAAPWIPKQRRDCVGEGLDVVSEEQMVTRHDR